MAVVPVYNCFHPVMKQKTQDVVEFNDEIKTIAENLIDTMINTGNGVGLAANQIGETKSIFVIDTNLNKEEKPNPIVVINPKIIAVSDETEIQTEG
ncbi:MAG TPA: peptide deformylase, partial [Candidatus Kapabacteria bacterium]|nr:peptide deformylase [Candidatus Kapabacteria bacterium]